MNNYRSYCLSFLLTLTSASVLAESLERGAAISREGNGKGAPPCISCHGEGGRGNAQMGHPYLAGLPEAYLARQLQAFKSGQRNNAVMQPIAAKLEEADIQALAAYFAQLQLPDKALGKPATAEQQKLGETIAHKGRWITGVPACFQCHGAAGQGVGNDFPPLSGQPAAYLQQQLDGWAKGTRTGDPIGLMQSVVAGLTDGERSAVAHYLASMPPRRPSQHAVDSAKQD